MYLILFNNCQYLPLFTIVYFSLTYMLFLSAEFLHICAFVNQVTLHGVATPTVVWDP